MSVPTAERYRDTRARDYAFGKDRGLPSDARQIEDAVGFNRVLQDLWVQEIEFFENYGILPGLSPDTQPNKVRGLEGYEVELSGLESETFNRQLHPQVEGYEWQRGIAVKIPGIVPPLVGGNLVFLFIGEMKPDVRGGSPDPIAYIDGNVGPREVLEVVRNYANGRKTSMQELASQITS